MKKLLEHFALMQGQVSAYLKPNNYNAHTGGQANNDPSDASRRDKLFIADMINLLDGPEQRAAQAEAEAAVLEHEQAADWRMDLRKQIAQADAVAKSWMEKAKELQVENNELRGQLHEALLNAERMRGYMDAVEDNRPPRMVEEQRERRFGRYREDHNSTRGWSVHESRPKQWFER